MEAWRKTLRVGFAPQLSEHQILSLIQALEQGDERLIRQATTHPPPLMCVADWPCEGACLVGYAGLASGLETVGEVEEFFARTCLEIDQRMGEPAACRFLLNFWDEVEDFLGFRLELAKELRFILDQRRKAELGELIEGITPSTVHGEWDVGPCVGEEIVEQGV